MHRLRTDPPEEVLRRLAAGTAIPIKQLRKMRLGSTMRRCVNEVERLLREEPDAELARWLRGRTAKGYPAAGYQIWDLQNEIFCYLLFSGVSREEFHRELQHVQDYNNDMSD